MIQKIYIDILEFINDNLIITKKTRRLYYERQIKEMV
jgi:hypothetical protein